MDIYRIGIMCFFPMIAVPPKNHEDVEYKTYNRLDEYRVNLHEPIAHISLISILLLESLGTFPSLSKISFCQSNLISLC